MGPQPRAATLGFMHRGLRETSYGDDAARSSRSPKRSSGAEGAATTTSSGTSASESGSGSWALATQQSTQQLRLMGLHTVDILHLIVETVVLAVRAAHAAARRSGT